LTRAPVVTVLECAHAASRLSKPKMNRKRILMLPSRYSRVGPFRQAYILPDTPWDVSGYARS